MEVDAMEKEIIFRKARKSDLPAVFYFVRKSIRKMDSEGIHQWSWVYPTIWDFRRDIKNGHMTCGIIDGKIACIYVINSEYDDAYNQCSWKAPHSCFRILHRIVVNPKFQNKGIGFRTMNHMIEELKADGVESLRLDVFSENPYSLRLYDKLGFEKVGEANWRMGLFYIMEKIF